MVELPATAAWRHVGARDGFEVLFVHREGDGHRFEGRATAVEEGVGWSVEYSIVVDDRWRTRAARIASTSVGGRSEVLVEGDGQGGWSVDGRDVVHVVGCLDVDLEASAFTNAFPVLRLGLEPREDAEAPAVYVRAPSLVVERLEQQYVRLEDEGGRARYDYESPRFDYRDVLVYDEFGLVLDYPDLALRVA